MKKIEDINTGTKMSIALSITIAVLLTVFGIYTIRNEKKMIIENSDTRLFEQVSDLINLIDVQIKENQTKVNSVGEMGYDLLIETGTIRTDNNRLVSATVMNQETRTSERIQLPTMSINNDPIYENYEFVDKIVRMSGGTSTIFQRFDSGYLRVSTSIKDSLGQRVVNTFIPFNSAVAQALDRGETYKGRAKILGQWYLTVYKPLKVDNRVVGAFYFGLPEKDLNELRPIFVAKKYYTNGYPYAVDSNGDFILHPTSEGQNIANEDFFKEFKKANSGRIEYMWQGEPKLQHYEYYAPADLYVATTIYEKDLLAAIAKVRNSVIVVIILGILIALLVGFVLGRNFQSVIKNLVNQIKTLTNAAIDGQLKTRADPMAIGKEFREIVIGINGTLDALITPLNMAADYISMISIGDMPEEITEHYSGDFNVLKQNMNTLIRALNEIIEKAGLMAGGDLMVDLKKRSDGDELMQSLNDMVKAMANTIAEFQIAANNISASSQQMSSTSQQMSQGATEQASSAEEVSSSMEEMAANIQQNTDNAQQTEKIAINAADGINTVINAAGKTTDYMQEIAEKVSIIGEIARQTNILALNAAVEAARAGEHGKGFAVVAAEVRKLAERSQVSAVEIDELARNSVKATDEAGHLLTEIAPEIGKTAKLVQEIAAASIEQNSGADQVNNAIQQLNQVTQQNAAASEEMATSSEELASQAQQLLEMISFFKIEGNNKVQQKAATAQRTSYKPKDEGGEPVKEKTRSRSAEGTGDKGVYIHMGKDNLDSSYEHF